MAETTYDARIIKDTTANPAPLGLMAFGMTTVLLNLANIGAFKVTSMVLGMAICYGGIAQVIAGIMEWKKNNTFGTVAFLSFGLFWLSFVALETMPHLSKSLAPSAKEVGWYLLCWGVFTGLMFVATLRINRSLQTVFLSLTVLFFLLAWSKFAGNATILKIAGWEGVFVGLSAVYGSTALIWNEYYGKIMLPLGVVQK
jgi:succinate-acetate transporter protein